MLEELQSLDETTKRRLLVIATIIIMVIVVGIWISYLNSIVAGPVAQATSSASVAMPTSTPAPAGANGLSIWQNIEHWVSSVADIFRKPSQYTIQPNQ